MKKTLPGTHQRSEEVPGERSRRLPLSRRSLLKLAGALAAFAGGLPRLFGSDSAKAGPPIARGYPYQLHLHAHSSHANATLSREPGVLPAMEAQSHILSTNGVRHIWWSDHDHSFPQTATWTKTYDPPVKVGVGGSANLPKPFISPETRVFVRNTNRSSPPLYAKPVITLEYRRGLIHSGRRINMFVKLAWHYRDGATQPERDMIHIQFKAGVAGEPVQKSSNVVFRRLPLPFNAGSAKFRTIAIPLDLDIYPISEDNLIGGVDFSAVNTWIEIRKITVHCQAGTRDMVLEGRRRIAAANEITYDTTEYVGVEHSASGGSNPAAIQIQALTGPAHVNLFLPTDPDVTQPEHSRFLDVNLHATSYTAYAHEKEGVASLNHPFGTSPAPPSQEPNPAEAIQVGRFLLDNNVHGADLLEVGYLRGRGQVSFLDHLRAWDILLANQKFLSPPRLIGGLGVSDAHGAAPEGESNPYCTWLVPDVPGVPPSRVEAVALLRRARAFFGAYRNAPGVFLKFPENGHFDFQVGELQMGQSGTVITGPDGEVPVTVDLSPAQFRPPNTVLKLIELPVTADDATAYNVFDAPAPPEPIVIDDTLTTTVTLDTEAGKIFRLELWSPANEPIAFSNPILARPQPAVIPSGDDELPPNSNDVTVTPTPTPTPTATPTSTPTEQEGDGEGGELELDLDGDEN